MEKKVAHFFVDEAGDLTFFDQKGRIIVGEAGVSKDDVPEVRREVFALLAQTDLKVFVGIRRKKRLAADVRLAFLRDGVKRRSESVYDDLVTLLFKERLHLAERNHIIFARRGKADRNIALSEAIRRAKRDFDVRWKKGIDRPTTVSSSVPSESSCLQAIDYCLWALQRMVERREERYFALLRDKFRLVLDRDDDRRHGYGEYYTSRNPLTLERLMPVT